MSANKRMIVNSPQDGAIRHDVFSDLIKRYHEACAAGFYLEAVTLMESLIADRLECILLYHNPQAQSFLTLERLLRQINQIVPTPIPNTLINEIKQWKDSRNNLLHETAKIGEGDTRTFSEKYADAQLTAQKGLELFRSIDKIIRESKKTTKP